MGSSVDTLAIWEAERFLTKVAITDYIIDYVMDYIIDYIRGYVRVT